MLGDTDNLQRVTANVDELIEALVENFERHKREYNEACAAYRDAAHVALESRLAEVDRSTDSPPSLKFPGTLLPPRDHRDDYERAIGMLRLHKNAQATTIHITADQYAAFVQDKWGWTEKWKVSNSFYEHHRKSFA